MNITMKRLYEQLLALKLISHEMLQSEVAKLLNVSQQKINNWESRGISSEGLIDIQLQTGISATYLKYGNEEFATAKVANGTDFNFPLSLEEKLLLNEFKNIKNMSAKMEIVNYVRGYAAAHGLGAKKRQRSKSTIPPVKKAA